jgi:hypothetical protein
MYMYSGDGVGERSEPAVEAVCYEHCLQYLLPQKGPLESIL